MNKLEIDDLTIRLMALGNHCAATSDQTEELCSKVSRKKISRRKTARELKQLECHMEGLRFLLMDVIEHLRKPSEICERN